MRYEKVKFGVFGLVNQPIHTAIFKKYSSKTKLHSGGVKSFKIYGRVNSELNSVLPKDHYYLSAYDVLVEMPLFSDEGIPIAVQWPDFQDEDPRGI